MPVISNLKETLALVGTDPSTRENVITQTAVATTEDWYYYTGLVLLQKLSAALDKTTTTTASRTPTDLEASLLKDMYKHLNAYKNQVINSKRLEEIQTRFYLLTWFINTTNSKHFVDTRLNLKLPKDSNLVKQPIDNNKTTHDLSDTTTKKSYPSSLDKTLLDTDNLIQQLIDNNELNQIYDHSWPFIQKFWSHLNNEQQSLVLKTILSKPVPVDVPIASYLTSLWRSYENSTRSVLTENVNKFSLKKLTLDQLNELQCLFPAILQVDTFVTLYMEKLVPQIYVQENEWASGLRPLQGWDELETKNDFDSYLSALDQFADKLIDGPFRLVKARITFQRLRSTLLRGDYDQSLLLAYLSQSRVKMNSDANSPVSSRTSVFQRYTQTQGIEIPILGNCSIPEHEENQIIVEYLTALISTQKLTSIDIFGPYLDLETFLEPLQAKAMLTSGLVGKDDITSWSKVLGSTAFENLVEKSTLTFGSASIHQGTNRLTKDDAISLYVTIKNIPRLTIRVFPIDLFNYWKLHPKDITIKNTNKLDVDGLCPIYEHRIDYTDVPSLRVINEKFIFGASQNGKDIVLAPEVFQGRGAWMIDLIGGQDQSRAIVQKGYLRHMVQNTAAGHLFLILDENYQPLIDSCSIWFENDSYEADKYGNILIPYRSTEGKQVRALLTTKDGYCQPFEFYHEEEEYSLKASFYLNYESLIPTKQSKVIVTPYLRIQNQLLPEKLLEKLSLQVETTNSKGVKSSISKNDLKASKNKPIECDFTVPSSLTSIKFILSAQVKTMSHDQPWKQLQVTKVITCDRSDQDDINTAYLRATSSGYFIHVIGKNGEPHKGQSFDILFKPVFTYNSTTITMQTDENGIITLGPLDNMETVTLNRGWKTWHLLADNWESVGKIDEAVLPRNIQFYANTEFNLPFPVTEDTTCTLFQTGFRGLPIIDVSKQLRYSESTVTVVDGLPEGSYCLYISRPHLRHVNSIEVKIVDDKKGAMSSSLLMDNNYWKNWMIGDRSYGETTDGLIKRPLCVDKVQSSTEQLTFRLKDWTPSSSAYAIVTSNAFLPSWSDSLFTTQQKNIQNKQLLYQSLGRKGLDHIYLTGRKISEEYQYILNRSKMDKYIGSALPEPSLLVNPKKHGSTTVSTRTTDQGNKQYQKMSEQQGRIRSQLCSAPCSGRFRDAYERTNLNFGFLNQSSPVLVLQVNDQGEVTIDRDQLGEGNVIQAVIVSGDQAVSRTLVLSDKDVDLKTNDQRQTDQGLDVNAAYLRNKMITVISSVHPQNTMIIDQAQQESEIVDSQDMLLDVFKLLVPTEETSLAKFDILRKWLTLDKEEKLKAHESLNSHELNLWIKHKDNDYFEENIKPFIQNKIHKTFMDDYLIDADLTKYIDSLSLFQNLNVVEKALLAKRLPQALPVVLQFFKNNYEPSLSDQPFDTVLAGNALAVPLPVQTEAVSYSAHSIETATYLSRPIAPSGASRTAAAPMSSFGQAPLSNRANTRLFSTKCMDEFASSSSQDDVDVSLEIDDDIPTNENSEGHEDEDDDDIDMIALREKAARQRQTRKTYEYMESTSEWKEQEYYGQDAHLIKANQFWIDYLENNLDLFVSGNVIYATSNITEMIFALAISDLPMKSNINYQVASDMATGKTTITATTPLMVFYRTLKECTQAAIASPSLLLGQHFFEKTSDNNGEADDQHIVEPSQLLARTVYGWHLAISNISTKTVICEVTLQIPTGAIPLGETPYCQSKNILIKPYTTWHEVVGLFYFPTQGNYHHFAVTIGERQKNQLEQQDNNMTTMALVNQTQPLSLTVTEMEGELQRNTETALSAYASWSVVNSTGTGDDVLAFVANHVDKLDSLDWSLVIWRMTHYSFARCLLSLLKGHKYYVKSIYAYGIYHGFPDIISDLLVQERSFLLEYTGIVFDSPLVQWKSFDYDHFKILDYYPIANARVHSLGGSKEIANKEFYNQYDQFLDYLNQSTHRTANDYVILSIYLVLQERIGEAQQIYQQYLELSKHRVDNDIAAIQADYLGAYLATRVKIGDNVDILAIKETVAKYKSCGSLRWRRLFTSLDKLITQVENNNDLQENDMIDTQSKATIGTDPVFDFTIKDNQVIVRHANVTQIQVRFYNINVESMFSNQPFLNNANKMLNYGWVKANHVEIIDLQEESDNNNVVMMDDTDELEWVGVSKVKPRRHAVGIPLVGDVLVQVHAHGKTQCQTHFQHTLTVHVSEPYGVARVLASAEERPLPGVYVKVYAKLKDGKTEFWKDGYTNLTGVFDYISVTQGNALIGDSETGKLQDVVKTIQKFALLFSSPQHGVVVKEATTPF
ncbi:uncharacterized protein BX664DRAFT_298784 [Halteromyces radiatus]|uniref:uncharacterized protein n=1 Tax=Halteromyces radiatus TaxID=101107 RepID=UPI00221FF496|nr:uncharacterized protein BX664DRAFT_298784 [Halteromyces radiatus]KAI8086266.1 hypothetical protein BX664DRAFT_298784 [Halteromyces radiatus]